MKRLRAFSVCAYAFRPAEPPVEMQLWQVGENPTDYGVHRWTERSAREVMAFYQARGNPLQVDVEHNNSEPGEPGPAGGYARLELRDGAPWLVFEWSAYAIGQIATRQRLFLSPEYDVDKQTSEIVRLVRVSLVADAGTHNARMLARIAATTNTEGNHMNLAFILAALTAAANAEDPEAAKAGIMNLIAELKKAAGADGGADEAPPGTDPEAAAAPGDPAAAGDDPTKKPVAAAAADDKDPTKCAAAPAGTTSTEIVMANRVAQLEADAKRRDAREAELEAEARVSAAGERIPESLRAFAKKLTKSDYDTFVKGLPEPIVSTGKVAGIRASAKPTQGDTVARPEGELAAEDARHMARVFGTENRPEESITMLPNGRIRATHITRPKSATNGKV